MPVTIAVYSRDVRTLLAVLQQARNLNRHLANTYKQPWISRFRERVLLSFFSGSGGH
jgi:hypothetical protein